MGRPANITERTSLAAEFAHRRGVLTLSQSNWYPTMDLHPEEAQCSGSGDRRPEPEHLGLLALAVVAAGQ